MSRHRWTSADLARLRAGPGLRARLDAPEPNQAPGLNAPHDPLAGATKLERRYAAWLDQEQAAGRVVAWRYEPIALVLSRKGRGLRYTPDMGVVVSDPAEPFRVGLRRGSVTHTAHPWSCMCGCREPARHQLELVEVKPRRKNGEPLWLGDSRTKVLAAAEWLRWSGIPLVLVLPNGDGSWERRVL